MKSFYLPFALMFLLLCSCKETPKTETAKESPEEVDILEKVALAHGYDQWKTVEEIRFTFNVDRDTSHFERSWIWKPKQNEVTVMMAGDTVTYLRSEVDSTLAKYDSSFINDKYWFLVPFQLVWDEKSFSYEHIPQTTSPLAGTPMQKLTIVYGNEGGYTPGDAYDLYLDANNMVREWTFRRGNKPEGNHATWEGYEEHNGMQLATSHDLGGGARLYFSGVRVK